jgi:hypothetical protein
MPRPLTTAAILLASSAAGATSLWLFQQSGIACPADNTHPPIISGTPEATALQKATPYFERLFRTDMKTVRTHLEQPAWADNKEYWFVVFEPSRGKTLAGCAIPDPKAAWMAQVRKSDLKIMNAE